MRSSRSGSHKSRTTLNSGPAVSVGREPHFSEKSEAEDSDQDERHPDDDDDDHDVDDDVEQKVVLALEKPIG